MADWSPYVGIVGGNAFGFGTSNDGNREATRKSFRLNSAVHNPVVFVVDDEASIRKALKSMLEAAGYEVQTFARASEFLAGYVPSQPGCLVLDVRMPGMDGLELQRYLTEHHIQIPVIILTGHGDVSMAVRSMESGAVSFLEKPADPDALLQKVAAAMERDRGNRKDDAQSAETRSAYNSLTPREREVMELLIEGKKPKTIAQALGITQSTIRVQRATILKKMRADSVTDLLRMMQAARSDSD